MLTIPHRALVCCVRIILRTWNTATYLASEEQKNRPNLYSYLWPYSGTFSAVNALMEATKDNKKDFGNYQKLLDEKVLPGLA